MQQDYNHSKFFNYFDLHNILSEEVEKSHKRTKMVCTIGPACGDMDTLCEMLEHGMNVARLNFSHGTHEVG